MRLAFISDIHGNATALDAVLMDLKDKSVEKIYVLGDLCFRGPEPKRSLEIVKSLDAEVIKGNADEWVVRGVKKGEVPDQALNIMNKEREWTFSHLDQDSIDYLKNLPTDLKLEYEGIIIHAFHATPDSLFDVVHNTENDEALEKKMMVEEANVYIYAHIHRPYVRFLNGKCIINIGSVGLPFDGLDKASYMILDISENHYQVSIVRVSYDVQKVIHQISESDYPNNELLIKILQKAKV